MNSIVLTVLSCLTIASVYGCNYEAPQVEDNPSSNEIYSRRHGHSQNHGIIKKILFGVPHYSKDYQIEQENQRKMLNYLAYLYLNFDRKEEP